MWFAETWRGRFVVLAAGVMAALAFGRSPSPGPTPVPRHHHGYTCPLVAEAPSGWCGFDEAPRITIDQITVASDSETKACGLLQEYVDDLGACATREPDHAVVEVRLVNGRVSATAAGAAPAVNRCIEEHAYRFVGVGDDVNMHFVVAIAAPHTIAE